ncbi:hypothetical protein PspLS_07131 [Pyricularia sp. CBS 133598]|nr:hypothetical protein PspLS_07131 [Pyricularia sp. CBS 133598]
MSARANPNISLTGRRWVGGEAGRSKFRDREICILNPDAAPRLKALITMTLVRPARLLFTEPHNHVGCTHGICHLCTLFYLQAESIPLVFQDYWSVASSGFAIVILFIKPMYMNLGHNVATAFMAGIATVFCVAQRAVGLCQI